MGKTSTDESDLYSEVNDMGYDVSEVDECNPSANVLTNVDWV